VPTPHIILYTCLVLLNIVFVIAWIMVAKRRQLRHRPSWGDFGIGCGTNFLDTLGIGNYAQITALFKLRGRPADELIPGTLNVGNTIPSFVSTLLFTTAINVDPVLLTCMVLSAGAGAWVGAGIVSRMKQRTIQLFMGVALFVAAFFFTMTNVGVLPPTGTAMSLEGWRFAVAVGANFILGALMCVGIGNYAPSMALLAFLGMHPIAAYPIMIGSDGVLIPVASLGFLKTGRFAPGVAVGLTLGGVVGTLLAFPLVTTLGEHLTLLRWVVIGVITYAAVTMLRSAAKHAVANDSGEALG
jgi:uncharacterized membrane protein YfcA